MCILLLLLIGTYNYNLICFFCEVLQILKCQNFFGNSEIQLYFTELQM